MSKTLKLRLLILSVTLAVGVGAYHLSMEDMMVQTAKAFTDSLTPEQRSIAITDFKNEEREKFHFVPDSNFEQTYGFKRPGLTYIRMQPEQRHLADALLSASLSRAGFIKAKTIMSLEEVLRIKEADLTGRRDPLRYYVRIYGEPSKDGAWGWRIEGHHMSLHFAMKGGKLVSSSPTFFGANPHKVDISARQGLRALPAEEDLGFELIGMLNADQKKKAIIDAKAYPDILTGADTRAKLDRSGAGLPASEMTPQQVEKLMSLIEEYASNLPAEVAAKRMEQAKSAPKDKLLFAWAGATERNIGDYYRIQAPAFLIEYDNTQNGANHTHTVWRDWNNDFGRDVLALHRLMYDHSVAAD
jgi:2-oxo-4-hydroxy-4-carboxy--5-ureidoimidazoline (OHCU) decarboxylase